MILTGFLFGLGFIIAIIFFYFLIKNLELILPLAILLLILGLIIASIIGVIVFIGSEGLTKIVGIIILVTLFGLVGNLIDKIFKRMNQDAEKIFKTNEPVVVKKVTFQEVKKTILKRWYVPMVFGVLPIIPYYFQAKLSDIPLLILNTTLTVIVTSILLFLVTYNPEP